MTAQRMHLHLIRRKIHPSSLDDTDPGRSSPETSPELVLGKTNSQDPAAHAAVLQQATTSDTSNVGAESSPRKRQSIISNASSLRSSRPPSRPPSSGGPDSREPSTRIGHESPRKQTFQRRASGGRDGQRRSTASQRRDATHDDDQTAAERSDLIVRDFAFPRDDPRFSGKPHPDEMNRTNEPDSAYAADEDDEPASSSGFSWGFVTSHQADIIKEGDYEQRDDEQSSEELTFDDLGEFVPGVYEALYDFAPELETEMPIQAGEIVTVISRQCAGWVQAGRVQDGQVTGEIGLVPENYLQLIDAVDQDEQEHEIVTEPESADT
ncbi:hypothetical protein OIV83_000346 [Microbotryomycetes sp. JL201]|nr:hypothetical protein OIV83_000346 [Microbotryomycetes sp. JL201]